MKGKTNSSQPAPLNATALGDAFSFMFNEDAKELFKVQSQNLIHQYNEIVDDRAYLYNLVELLGLLGLKSCQNNPYGQFYVRKVAKVRYFGTLCKANEVIPGIHKIINAINHMASQKWLKASLYNLGMMELASDPLDPSTKRFVIFSYLAVSPDHEQDVDLFAKGIEFQEGAVPPEFK
jgi:hypothetical protein